MSPVRFINGEKSWAAEVFFKLTTVQSILKQIKKKKDTLVVQFYASLFLGAGLPCGWAGWLLEPTTIQAHRWSRTSLPPLLQPSLPRSFGGGQQSLYPYLLWGQKSERSWEEPPSLLGTTSSRTKPGPGWARPASPGSSVRIPQRSARDRSPPVGAASVGRSHSRFSLRSLCPSLDIEFLLWLPWGRASPGPSIRRLSALPPEQPRLCSVARGWQYRAGKAVGGKRQIARLANALGSWKPVLAHLPVDIAYPLYPVTLTF